VKIKREDVVAAYRIFLNREPENEDAIKYWLEQDSISELRNTFLRSAEYRSRMNLGSIPSMSGLEPKMISEIDKDIAKEDLEAIFEKVQGEWHRLGEEDPLWAVLSLEKYHESTRSDIIDEFYSTGFGDIDVIEKTLIRNEISLPAQATVLELGCGAGRVTSHLAKKFEKVIGVDISKTMLEVAKKRFMEENIDNASFLLLNTVDEFDKLPKCDLLFSFIAFQHSPPPVISRAIRGAIRSLNINGVAIFQVPTYIPNYKFTAHEYLRSSNMNAFLHSSQEYEMHAVRQCDLFKIIDAEGGRVLEVYEDIKMGPEYPTATSNTFLIEKIR
jgi:SAM-dependent methyltransferase